jgi:hypothetical protein
MAHLHPRTLSHALGITVSLGLLLAAAPSAGVEAQESGLRAERVVDYEPGKAIPLTVKVGPVSIESVEFSDRGRAGSGGLGSLVRGAAPSEMSTTIRAHFLAENATPEEWEVAFTLEFLDDAGKLIDRATKKSTWEGQAKATDLDHPILQYVVPFIEKVRIKMEARLD